MGGRRSPARPRPAGCRRRRPATGSQTSTLAPRPPRRSPRYACRSASARGGSPTWRAVVSNAIRSPTSATSSSRRASMVSTTRCSVGSTSLLRASQRGCLGCASVPAMRRPVIGYSILLDDPLLKHGRAAAARAAAAVRRPADRPAAQHARRGRGRAARPGRRRAALRRLRHRPRALRPRAARADEDRRRAAGRARRGRDRAGPVGPAARAADPGHLPRQPGAGGGRRRHAHAGRAHPAPRRAHAHLQVDGPGARAARRALARGRGRAGLARRRAGSRAGRRASTRSTTSASRRPAACCRRRCAPATA